MGRQKRQKAHMNRLKLYPPRSKVVSASATAPAPTLESSKEAMDTAEQPLRRSSRLQRKYTSTGQNMDYGH